MIKTNIKLIKTLEIMNKRFSLPNSVSILKNNDIVIADGGNNRINLYTYNGTLIKTIGEYGFGRYKFKEPVGAFVSPDQKIYVMDWHNHRVVIYTKELIYLGEFGHLCKLNENNKYKIYLYFLKQMFTKGTYFKYHFNKKKKYSIYQPNKNIFSIFFNGIKYWVKSNNGFFKSLRRIKDKKDFLYKPNGIAFINDKIFITQKKNNCISVYENADTIILKKNYISFKNGKKFGRLGNLKSNNKDILYICDEKNHKIYICNKYLKILNTIQGKNNLNDKFSPFSCDIIDNKILITCGGFNFQIISLHDKKVLFLSENLGELHGIAYNSKRDFLYVVNRSKGLIHIYELKFEEN